ncbi:MAG: peroxidase family protein [Acidimicrobiales bacterium]
MASFASAAVVASMTPAMVGAADRQPWEGLEDPGNPLAPVGQGFNVTPADLVFILDQIKIAENHAATRTDLEPCSTLIGPGPNQIPEGGNAFEFPFGLRTISGECNNLRAGQEFYGAADQVFPRLTNPDFRAPYNVPTGNINDPEPREISNLIVDQTDNNPAAVAAAGLPPVAVPTGAELEILNVAPDAGLSAPYNSMLTFFGQFFDHGLDLVEKNSSELVIIPLDPSDPLYVPGSPMNFMVINRTVTTASDAGNNKTTPYVDQNQTYGSHPSKNVFLREFVLNGTGQPVATGALIEGASLGMATWGELKADAAAHLGIQLVDLDVHNVPLLLTDPYGKFVPGPARGMPQMVLNGGGLLEGDPAANGGAGVLVPANALRTGHTFLDDIAHAANPNGSVVADADAVINTAPGATYVPNPGATVYDDEMLAAHYMAGDGRANENIALTSVHHVFHSEHNRLVADIQNTLLTNPAITPAFLAEWQLATGAGGWNGDRLFQAAKFVTEMEYQHLVFEEFGRTISPDINVFLGYDSTIDAAINAEFAHAVYRFGHSMLNTDVARYKADGTPDDIALFDAFLNPPAWLAGYGDASAAAGAVFRGGVAQQGNEIDEFVVDALRNQLLGLPLDLPAINIGRGRDAGVARLNQARREFYAATNNDPSLKPYDSWLEFGFELKTPESLVNFIAAYGTHPDITAAGSDLDARRVAAQAIVDGTAVDASDFMLGSGIYANVGGIPVTGLEDVDLWVGGLAEKKQAFGGFLGTTFNFVFERQMENLQNGDRFYYLGRVAGTDLLNALEGNSFSELVMRNTDAEGLPAVVFTKPTYNFNVAALGTSGPILDDPTTGYDESALLVRLANGTIRYAGEEHANWNGTPQGDRIQSGDGDDTVRGNDGDDVIEGGQGNDNLVGGEGHDRLTDSFGIDTIKGGPGNDYISGGPGVGDLLQGGTGNDFFIGGNDGTEHLAGDGDDFIFAGSGPDIAVGDYGNDWIDGGADADALTGDLGNPFLNDPVGGNDVLYGGAGADITLAEGGTDIIIHDTGTDDHDGGLGFDWYTHYGDPLGADTDLNFGELTPAPIDPLRDRFNLVEALSGWDHDDILRGDGANPLDIGSNDLDADGIALIPGLEQILPTGVSFFASGNIILGGGGSDILQGRADDDILDGDAYLIVQLDHNGTRYDTLSQLRTAVDNGTIPLAELSNVTIHREILPGAPGTDIDRAVFQGPLADYDITTTPDGVQVVHARGNGLLVGSVLNDGTDLLKNIEELEFADQVVPVTSGLLCNSLPVTVDLSLGQTPTTGDDVILGTNGDDSIDALDGNDTICMLGGDDLVIGGPGNDWIDGGAGNDTISGNAGADTILGGDGADSVFGGSGNDIVEGQLGDDLILGGGSDADIILGQDGNDTINGGSGADLNIDGGIGDDFIAAGGDNDLFVFGGEGNDQIGGNGGADVINGDAGNDTLYGGQADDQVFGGDGDDFLGGNGGIDVCDGGTTGEVAGDVAAPNCETQINIP